MSHHSLLHLGIDGGATHSYAVAATPDGEVVATARAGSLNFLGSNLATARRSLAALLTKLRRQLPHGAAFHRPVIGCAAIFTDATPAEKRALCAGLLPLRGTRVVCDAQTAYCGATLGRPGVVIVAGTGSIVLARGEGGRFSQTGGWGHLLGDEGSAWWIARESVRAALAAFEGRGPHTRLEREVCRYFGVRTPYDVVTALHAPATTKDRAAALAEFLARRLASRDAVFRDILQRAGRELAAPALAALRIAGVTARPVPVHLVGGVLAGNRPVRRAVLAALRKSCPVRVCTPALAPVLGALVLSLTSDGQPLSRTVLHRLRRFQPKSAFPASVSPLQPRPRLRARRPGSRP